MNPPEDRQPVPITLADAVARHARSAPDAEAVVYGEIRCGYSDLDVQVDRYAAALRAGGVARGERIAVLSTPRPEFLLTLLAAMRIGAVWVGLNPRYQLPELDYVLGHCQPVLLVSLGHADDMELHKAKLRALSAAAASLRGIVTLGAAVPGLATSLDAFLGAGDAAAVPAGLAPPPLARSDPAVIVYTSGSTGRPKGAVLPHATFFHSHAALSESLFAAGDGRRAHRIICNLPVNHVGCLADVCGSALIEGGTIVFMDGFEPARIPAVIERERITMLGGLPLMHQQVFEQSDLARFDLSSLQVVAWGGAAMPRPLLERLLTRGYRFSMHYGLTEGGSINSVSAPGASLEFLTETIGRPDHDHDYRVVTAAGAFAGSGEVGEIQIRGAGVMLEYFGDPQATRAAFTDDGWLKTGDLVEIRADGAWRFVGRFGDMFKSGGYNVYPREIELALEKHPSIAAAAIVGVPDSRYDEVGWAFVVAKPTVATTEADLKAYASERLANYKIPKRFLLVKALPVLPVGKVDKRALRALALAIASAGATDTPLPAVTR